jgi:hypothetical protein
MTCLKEREKRKNQREEERENQQPQLRAREGRVFVADLNEIESRPSAHVRGITRIDLKEAANKTRMSAAEVNAWQRYMEEVGWRFSTGTCINWCNFRRSLRMWHKTEDRLRSERGESAAVERQSIQDRKVAKLTLLAKRDPSIWGLCRESCANCGEHGCALGVAIPPDRQVPRPHPPQECPKFAERKEAV